jgi:NADPH-dependent curcumin reductase CurA
MTERISYIELLKVLADSQVKMVVVGGVAMVMRSVVSSTFDIDVCYEKSQENIERLCRALAPHCPAIKSAFSDVIDLLTDNQRSESFVTTFGRIDLMGEVSGLGNYEDVLRHSTPVAIQDFVVQALTVNGLITAKEAANRPKDQPHLNMLRTLKEMEDEENN